MLTVSTDVGVSYWGRYVRQLITDGNSNICGDVSSPLLPVMACYTRKTMCTQQASHMIN